MDSYQNKLRVEFFKLVIAGAAENHWRRPVTFATGFRKIGSAILKRFNFVENVPKAYKEWSLSANKCFKPQVLVQLVAEEGRVLFGVWSTCAVTTIILCSVMRKKKNILSGLSSGMFSLDHNNLIGS